MDSTGAVALDRLPPRRDKPSAADQLHCELVAEGNGDDSNDKRKAAVASRKFNAYYVLQPKIEEFSEVRTSEG